MNARVALATYSSKPRGSVVHTLALAEALAAAGRAPTVFALGDTTEGFYRPVAVPHAVIPSPPWAPTLEERVLASVAALSAGVAARAAEFDILHAQDCIAAQAVMAARGDGAARRVLRTVHHVDDFTTPALIDCQTRSILEPDRLLVVSQHWRQRLRQDYGVESTVVPNGVDASRFGPISAERRAARRRSVGAGDRFVFLAVGGIEPRKGSVYLLEALGILKARRDPSPVLVVVGGHSFQDYTAYRESTLARLTDWGLELGRDVVLVGTVSDDELAAWYRAADALACPSLKEGWGLVVLEALSAELPVVATDMAVFREYLTDGADALLAPVADAEGLASAMARLMVDGGLRDRLRQGGLKVAARYQWADSARRHMAIYDEMAPKS